MMLELYGKLSNPSLLLGSLWPGMVASDWDLSIRQIELNYIMLI